MIAYIQTFWNDHGFEILVTLSIVVIVVATISRIGQQGTLSPLGSYLPKDRIIEKSKPKDSKGELICRAYLEKLFNKPFAKARPDFLRNPVTGGDYNLELDCFNSELKLALEYNGVQHYKFTPYFHKNKEAFMNQKYRDEMKRTRCKEYGIRLIEVPYTIKHHMIESFIDKEIELLLQKMRNNNSH